MIEFMSAKGLWIKTNIDENYIKKNYKLLVEHYHFTYYVAFDAGMVYRIDNCTPNTNKIQEKK